MDFNLSERMLLLAPDARKFYLLRKELYDSLEWSYDTLFLDGMFKNGMFNNPVYMLFWDAFALHSDKTSVFYKCTMNFNSIIKDINLNDCGNIYLNYNEMVDVFNSVFYIGIDGGIITGYECSITMYPLCSNKEITTDELIKFSNWYHSKTNKNLVLKDDLNQEIIFKYIYN